MSFRSGDDKSAYIKHCNSECLGHSDLALYQGCYEDQADRDLPIRIGTEERMNPEDCFREGHKVKGVKYVGLQFGGECWGGSTFGKYEKKNDLECNMICTEDTDLMCGAGWRNSVYFLTRYEGDEDNNYCADIPDKDCTRKGGYDKNDKCNQTCLSSLKLTLCEDKCFKKI